jgi:prepilin-type N-terminal cleavage/methylation domain-containing protein
VTSLRENGFSLIEAMIAILILGVSLLGLAQLFAVGLAQMAASGPDIIAREKATDAIESVFTARDTRTITFAEIRNVKGGSGNDGGVFIDGALPLTTAGNDGVVNTEDDGAIESMTLPGNDGRLGTADDQVIELTHFTREIDIRDQGPNLRRVRVIIRYLAGGNWRTYELDTFVSAFA